MRVITEETLTKVRNELSEKGNVLGACAIDKLITDHLEEIDQLTVSKLRPMSECKLGWLVKHKQGQELELCTAESSSGQICTSATGIHFVLRENYEGCIPPVIYKPEQP